jgi:D-beta-D-heptose 7-phosphate kinase/D-beta-D-heptose 1-phosphate adenosyltransferase
VRPHVVVLTEDHAYGPDQLGELMKLCERIEVIERQTSVTTSERIRQMYMHMGERLGPKLAEVLPGLIDSLLKRG